MKHTFEFKAAMMQPLMALFLLTFSSILIGQEQQPPTLMDFKIVIEKTENGIKMESPEGSAWKNLSFTIGYNIPQAINQNGMTTLDSTSQPVDPNLANYLFTIAKTEDGIVLQGIEGTAWKTLTFSLPGNERQAIDQFGMTD